MFWGMREQAEFLRVTGLGSSCSQLQIEITDRAVHTGLVVHVHTGRP